MRVVQEKEQSFIRLSEEVDYNAGWGRDHSSAAQSDWCGSQFVRVGGDLGVWTLGGGGGGGVVSEFSVAWGQRGGGGARTGGSSASWQPDGQSCPSVCWSSPGDSAVSSLMAADWRSCVSGGWDHLQCWGLCGWDGCCRCPGGRGERHQRSSQLLSLSVEGTCGRTRCRRHTTQWCS